MQKAVFSTAYLPPISYVAAWVQHKGGLLEAHENFVKQSYRNRCIIYGPNGKQALTVPVQGGSKKQCINDVKISYSENWPVLHWRSLEAAYKGRPFFDVLADEIKAILFAKHTYLFELNTALFSKILSWLLLEGELDKTANFIPIGEAKLDYRFAIHPKKQSLLCQPETYFQHFAKIGEFLPDLSIIDLIFSEGRASWDYLNNLTLKQLA